MDVNYDLENGLFSKIVRGEIPAKIAYQDEWLTAFHDIAPQAPVHLLIIPNRCIPTADHVVEGDEVLLGKMMILASKLAREFGLAEDGYRLIVNCKNHGGQVVYHLHMHLLGGEPLGPMRA